MTVAGAGLLRVDVPSEPPLTQFYPPSSLYCLTPTTEQMARALAKQWHVAPVTVYDLPRALPSGSDEEPEDDAGEPLF